MNRLTIVCGRYIELAIYWVHKPIHIIGRAHRVACSSCLPGVKVTDPLHLEMWWQQLLRDSSDWYVGILGVHEMLKYVCICFVYIYICDISWIWYSSNYVHKNICMSIYSVLDTHSSLYRLSSSPSSSAVTSPLQVGMMAKRILDLGRVAWLRQAGRRKWSLSMRKTMGKPDQ